MIVQNPSRAGAGATDISFTVPLDQTKTAIAALRDAQERIGFDDVVHQRNIGKISLIGAGMRSNPGVSATFFDALHRAGANIDLISTSEIRISVVTAEDKLAGAVQEIHRAFGLDADEAAVVHGGTDHQAPQAATLLQATVEVLPISAVALTFTTQMQISPLCSI